MRAGMKVAIESFATGAVSRISKRIPILTKALNNRRRD